MLETSEKTWQRGPRRCKVMLRRSQDFMPNDEGLPPKDEPSFPGTTPLVAARLPTSLRRLTFSLSAGVRCALRLPILISSWKAVPQDALAQ